MSSYHSSIITPMTFARDWTKYDYVTETRLDVMKRKLSKAIDYLRNKIEYNQKIARVLQEELRVQVENFRKDYPARLSAQEARDRRSVFVYNIGTGAVAEELKWHFDLCGIVKDVILFSKDSNVEVDAKKDGCGSSSGDCDDDDNKSNSVAYVEFQDEIYANIALCMTRSLFMGQRIRVVPRNMRVELNIMQAITTFWGQHLEAHFEHIGPMKECLHLNNSLSILLNEMLEIYIEAHDIDPVASSKKIFNLIRRSKELFRKFYQCHAES